ncbi:MAG: hypothetical protein M3O55_11350 [Actinomycetota bacterium]|nr:hypothetical protein [Actinomycetota bacterium]
MTEQAQTPEQSPEPTAAETHEVVEIDVVLVDGEVVEATVTDTVVEATLDPSLKTRHKTV